jgi:PII-like signaling protein
VEIMHTTSPTDHSPLAAPRSGDAVECTIYLSPSRREVSTVLTDAHADRALLVSHRMGVAEGFGRSRRVHTDTDAEIGAPIVLIAVDDQPAIDSLLGSCAAPAADLLVTFVATAVVSESTHALQRLHAQPTELAVHCRRGRGRDDPHGVGGVLEELRRHGVAGATALGRGDGTIAGHRYRPRLLSPVPDGPMLVVSIDQADVLARTARALLAMPQVELLTAKPISLCRWRGHREPPPNPTADRPAWSRITLYCDGESVLAWHPEHLKLAQRLRKQGAPGVTVLRGAVGYSLGDPLAGDGWFRRHATPTATTIIDTPDRTARWLDIIDDATGDHGLVTHEFVSTHRLM